MYVWVGCDLVDERFAEMVTPAGGMPWWEPDVHPMLADFECGCGELSCTTIHEQEVTMHEEETCKIDGCDGEIVDSRGPYAKLCQPHKDEKKVQVMASQAAARAARNGEIVPTRGELDEALLDRARVAGGKPSLEEVVDQAVEQTREAVEVAILAAAAGIADVLRERIADAIRGS